jgi:hypothetical protein
MEPQNSNQANTPEQQPLAPQAPALDLRATLMQPTTVPTQTNPSSGNAQNPPHAVSPQLSARAEKLKKLSLQVMIGGLIGAAVVAVVAVLAGSFNSTFEKALFTLFIVVVHALACLAFVEQTGKSKNSSFRFFENAVFSIIVLSFFTAIFGIWGLFGGSIVGKLYGTYLVLLFACLHGQMLVETRGKQAPIDTLVNANYAVMTVVIVLILPIIWLTAADFPGFYFRLLAACGIIDGTLTILAVILHRLYLQKHPEAQSAIFSVTTQLGSNGQPVVTQAVTQKRNIHPLVWLLGIFIIGQIVISLLFAVLGAFYRR